MPSTTIMDLIGGLCVFLVVDTALSVHWSVGPSLCDALVENLLRLSRAWDWGLEATIVALRLVWSLQAGI